MCPPAAIMARRGDDELVAELRTHDPCALHEIDRRHRAALRAHARRLLSGTGLDPEDAVQDTLLRAWTDPPSGPTALSAWLHVVLRNRGVDLLRAGSVKRAGPPLQDAVAPDDPAAAVHSREQVRAVTRSILALPQRQAQALALHAVGGYSHEEIARELGTSTGSVKQLVHRARRALEAAGRSDRSG